MDDDALRILTAKAESGDVDAQYAMALAILDDASSTDDRSWELDTSCRKEELAAGIRWLIIAARNGLTEAQTDLGKRYHYGIDMPENQNRAYEWFLKAAESGSAEAQFFVGEFHTADDIIPYDISTAVEWYERSAQQGFQWAQLALFDIYRNGADFSLPDLERGLYWGRRAGEQGNLSAQLNLGKIFFEGDIVERNPMEAAFWLHLASDLDDEAKYLLAILYFHGHGVEKNITKSAELLRNLARRGDSDAMVQLAIVLSALPRPPRDEIHSWLIKASELGHVHGQEMLLDIEMPEESIEAVQEEFNSSAGKPRTASQYRALAEAGDCEAQYCLGQMLEEGRDLQVDYEEALYWYGLAADSGHAAAQWRLSVCFQAGLGIEPDDEEAFRWLEAAADGGNAEAQLHLGWRFYIGANVPRNERKAFQLFKRSSDQWNLDALVWQGHCYELGTGVPVDKARASELYRKAAELGVVTAQYKLGLMYLRGDGIDRHDGEAEYWFTIAARSDHASSLLELGRLQTQQSIPQAVSFFRRAAVLGDSSAKFELGRLLMGQESSNINEALLLILEAAHEDVVPAQVYLGRFFEQGHGEHKQDLQQAANWYRKAACLGDEDAALRLTALLSNNESFDLLFLSEERTASDTAGSAAAGKVIANKYVLSSEIAKGSYRTVFKGRNMFTDKIVAVNMLRPVANSDDMSIQRFQREAKAISRIDHPNVIRLQDFGIAHGGEPYLVLDFLKGLSLAEQIAKDGSLSVGRTLSIFLQIIDGLTCAHDAGITHSDIKPSNIMLLDPQGARELAKIVDFGVAKLFADPLSKLRRLDAETCVYTSPEQCQGQTPDARSDIYSLGCVLFEALTGKRPVDGNSFFDIMSQHLYQSPPSIREACPDANFSHQLDQIIRKMMAKNPNDRHQDLHALREDLREVSAAAA